ncbi:MAG: BspA family leucine-rich repeat surface protein, partial [Clostridia bacterium]|nr:BspA family leucine-rich repeat surface protein [Clostridia bacterium]
MRTAYKGTNRLWMLLIAMLLVCGMAFGAIAEESAGQQGTNDLDGSKIEGVKVIWVTQDSATTAEGAATPQAELDKKEHLYLSSVSDSPVEMVYRIEAEFSGQYDYAPGDITITIPAQVWHARKYEATGVEGETVGVVDENRLLGYLELPVPAAPSKKADFNWQIIDGNYVLTNTRTIGATSSVSIEVGIRGIRPVDVVDMSETAPITAHVEVVTNQGNTIELTSTPIVAQLDTQARITSAYKDGEVFEDYPGLSDKLLANLPAGAKPEDYIYVRWYTYHSHNNNQPYSLDIADVLSDAYKKVVGEDGQIEEKYVTDGIFLGSTNYEGQVLTDGEIDFTAEIGDHFTDTTTGTQYANTVYMWSAYKKSDFYVPSANVPQCVYYFKNEVTWTLTETDKTVEDSGNGKGEDPQKVTTAKDDVILPYAPVKWQRPRGAFAVNKWTERVGYKDWLYGYALNLLESREEVDMDFIVETVGYGYPWTSKLTKDYSYGELNNTVVNGDLEKLELDASAFGKLGWKQVTDDFQTFFNFETEPLTSEDFEFKSLRVSVPGKMRYAKKSNGTWDYVSDSTLPTPDLVIEYQLNNEDTWYPAATATWGEDGLGEFKFVNVADGVTTSGMTVFFPENVTDTRHTFISNVFDGKMAEQCDIAMLDWYVYPTITMKSSDRVYGIVQELFEQSENPSTKFRNDVIMDAYGWVGSDDEAKVLDDDYDYSMATYEGASYGVALTKSGTSESDAENQRLVIHYTATLTEQSNLKERSDYDEAVEAGVIPAETSGIWYDLLPPHVVPLLETVKLRKGDTITNVYTVEDYKDTGRTLLVVEAELTPVPASYNSIGYADRPTLEFDAAYTWMDMDEYGSELVNYVAFESTVEDLRNDTLGTIKNQMGDPDTPAGGNNANTPSMPEDIIKALTDLDPNTDENRFVYGKYSHTVSSLTYAVSGLQKAVKNDLVGIWTQGLDGQEQVTVYEGHYYTYSLRVSSAENTATKGIVIYDTIENYIIPDPEADKDTDATKRADYEHTQERVNWSGDWQGKGQWRGTLVQVDLSEFVNAGVKPVLLYSTIPNLQFADSSSESTDDNFDEDTELFSSGSYDITDREIWQVAELDENGIWHVPEGVAVTAVAIDATTTADGKEFVLKPEEALAGYLKMRAPDDDGSEDKWNAKGAYARMADDPEEIDWEAAMDETNNMYAYNNARVRLIQGQAKEGNTTWLSNYRMIRNDYTRVGIVPEIVTVEKTWQDQDNHDAMRPESVTINVLRRLAGTAGEAQPVLDKDGQPLTAVLDESNGWKAEFKQVDIVNEDGVRYLYTFEEEPVEGYTSKVQFIDVNHYTMINVHPNEQVDISGEKTWSDDNNALGFRPAVVTLKLYRDGEQIDTRIVKPNGAGEWKYTFGKLDKYAEGGKEYEYKVEEEYVPKYVGEANGYEMVNNTYIPVGALEVSKTLVGATDAAKDMEFTFTLVLLAEQTDPTAPAVPLMDKYAYTIYTLEGEEWVEDEIGEIGNSGTFKLKENQKIVVYDLPSEATYEVVESEAAGFTSTATDADGSIRAGQTVQAAFVNEYKASGSVQLNVGKSLTGHAIRKNQFRFELVDNNPDSPTYGEVIRTARVEAPEADATTGGSGETIESLTQAIFGQLEYTQADHGNTYNYQVREVDTGKSGYTADAKVYDVAVSVTDNGDGTMTVTPTWGEDASMLFENTYEAKGELTLKAWKTLEGRELKEGEFTFELYSYDAANNGLGEKLGEATNDAEGNIVFDALEFDQDDVSLDETDPATYTYLIREKQGTDKTVAYSNQEYVITVTVFDNGDGTLSFAQGSQGYTREYPSCSACGGLGLKRIEFTRHYNSSAGTGGNGFTPYRDSKTQAILQIICKECNGLTRHEDPSKNLANGYCAACGGSGIQANQTIIAGGKEYVFGNYRKSPISSQMIVPVEGYDCLGVAVCNYGDRQVLICESCYGARVEPGKMTITGEAAMPVFANTLKPGDLTVTKQVQGEGSSNPDQTFNFTIKLTGEVPEELDYGMTAPTPVPTATPAPAGTATAKPTAAPAMTPFTPAPVTMTQPNTPAPTTEPKPDDPDNDDWYKASESVLQGTAYAALNLNEDHADYGTLVFFRSSSTPPTDPWGNTFDLDGVKRLKDDEKNIVWYWVDESAGALKTVPNNHWGADDQRPWKTDYLSITAVDVRAPIKPLDGWRFFAKLSKLTTANIALLDTSGMERLAQFFYGCSSLASVDLSTMHTSNATDMYGMFEGCRSMTSLDLSSFDTSNVTNMSYMFSGCSGLTSLDLSSFDTSNVTYMGNMFNNCSKLTSLSLINFNTSKVTDMSSMFSSCSSLTSLDLSSFDTRNVTNMSSMFSGCSSLTELSLSTFDTSNVASMSWMFNDCSRLTSLDLHNFNTSNVTSMYGMFEGCSSLTNLDLSNFNTSSVTTMRSMFYDCSKLTELDLSSFATSNVTNMSYMFYNCSKLTELDLSTFDTGKVTNMSNMFYGCTVLESLDLRNFNTSNVTNMEYMFSGCKGLKSLELTTFNTGKVTNMNAMFASCKSLTSLDLSSFNTSKVTDMGSMFSQSGLTSLDLSSFDTSKGTNMNSMFRRCSGLTTLDLSMFNTSNVTNMWQMFCECTNLVILDLSNFDTGKVTDMTQMLFALPSFKTISIGANTKLQSYPSNTASARYTGMWVNVADEDLVFDGATLFKEGNHAGTWTKQLAAYKLAFAPGEGGAGAMPSVKVTCGTKYSFVPLFYQFGYDLIGFVDDNGKTYNLSGDLVTIPAYTYTNGQTVTLTAVWQKRDVTVSESGDTITFALKAGETFTLRDLPASLAYEVWEELPTGWVLVEKKDDTGVIKPLETSEAVFTNKYEPGKAQATLRASKTLDGKAPTGTFSFTLRDKDANEIETVQNNGSGVVFKPITYDKAGTYTYTIAEVTGTDETINYDENVYTVTVEVTDDGKGNLSAKVTYLDADGKELTEPPVFKNTTKPGALFISKAIIGPLTDKARKQEFTFEVTFTDELLNVWKTGTVSLKGGGSITLPDIPAGLKYEVKETGSYPGWTMDGTIKEGKIASNETAEVIFTNKYTLTGVASIEAKKVLVGRDLTAGEFTFQLVGENNNVVAEATNGADGRVLFPQMTYTEEGTWKYVIVEAKPNEDKIDNTVEYSEQRIKVTVTATDEKGDGTLTTTVTY